MDWGEALLCFFDWWSVNLRHFYGVGSKGQTDFWPEEAKKAAEAIQAAHDRLYYLVYGRTVEESNAAAAEILKNLWESDTR
jgi:hypothetical protein